MSIIKGGLTEVNSKLFKAVASGDVEGVKKALEAKASTWAQDDAGNMAYDYAIQKSKAYKEIVKLTFPLRGEWCGTGTGWPGHPWTHTLPLPGDRIPQDLLPSPKDPTRIKARSSKSKRS